MTAIQFTYTEEKTSQALLGISPLHSLHVSWQKCKKKTNPKKPIQNNIIFNESWNMKYLYSEGQSKYVQCRGDKLNLYCNSRNLRVWVCVCMCPSIILRTGNCEVGIWHVYFFMTKECTVSNLKLKFLNLVFITNLKFCLSVCDWVELGSSMLELGISRR